MTDENAPESIRILSAGFVVIMCDISEELLMAFKPIVTLVRTCRSVLENFRDPLLLYLRIQRTGFFAEFCSSS